MSKEMTYKIAALYKFVSLNNLNQLKAAFEEVCNEHYILGTILLAREGINGTIAGRKDDIDALVKWINKTPHIGALETKFSYADTQPFLRMKVRLKKEIVTLGLPDIDPSRQVGTYVDPEDWNALISDPDVLVIDTRNDYEIGIGTFEGAENPNTASFRELPAYVKALKRDPGKTGKKIAMFCTGGIRCEKASALMLSEGFDEVYHLKGGILKYLEKIPQAKSKWQGECFVFDNRVSVAHGLEVGQYDMCHACRNPILIKDKNSPDFRPGVCCPHCVGTRTAADLARFEERQKQVNLAKKRGIHHIGVKTSEKSTSRATRQPAQDTQPRTP